MIRKKFLGDSQRLGKMIKFSFFIFLLILSSCTGELGKNLVDDNSVWTFSKEDISNPNNINSAKLQFKNNGYVYETETILYYEWFYNPVTKILTINTQDFEVLSIQKNLIVLKNRKYGHIAKLTKVNP